MVTYKSKSALFQLFYPGVLARLWPLSCEQYPKQFLPLISENTMIQETLLRFEDLEGLAAPLVVCNEEHRFVVAEQLHQIDIDPVANTFGTINI